MRNNRGQSLMEVVVAATVGILVVAALTFATVFSLRNSTFSKTSVQATKLAQEALERTRTGRNRNATIDGSFAISGDQYILSWGDNYLWEEQISGSDTCLDSCYFNVDSAGNLAFIGNHSSLPSNAEPVGQFKRAIILSDDSSFGTQKTVTAVVEWTDGAGKHQSKLTTILGRQ